MRGSKWLQRIFQFTSHTEEIFFSTLPLLAYLTPIQYALISNPQFFSDSMNFMWPTSLALGLYRQKITRKVSLSISLHIWFLIGTEAKHFSTRFANFIFLLIRSSLNRIEIEIYKFEWMGIEMLMKEEVKKRVFNIFHSYIQVQKISSI